MTKIKLENMPVTLDGRIHWKHYFAASAAVGDQFVAPATMRSGIQRQAADCGFVARTSYHGPGTILINIMAPVSKTSRILSAFATLSEGTLIKIHNGCVQASILPPL